MSHADTLKGMAKAFTMVGSYEQADTCLAGAEAIDARDRVRAVLTGLRSQKEAALQRWDDTGHLGRGHLRHPPRHHPPTHRSPGRRHR